MKTSTIRVHVKSSLTYGIELVEYGGETLARRQHHVVTRLLPESDANEALDNLVLVGDWNLYENT